MIQAIPSISLFFVGGSAPTPPVDQCLVTYVSHCCPKNVIWSKNKYLKKTLLGPLLDPTMDLTFYFCGGLPVDQWLVAYVSHCCPTTEYGQTKTLGPLLGPLLDPTMDLTGWPVWSPSAWKPISGRTDGHPDGGGRTYGLRDKHFGGDNLQVPSSKGN
jgi:hypothetical protein